MAKEELKGKIDNTGFIPALFKLEEARKRRNSSRETNKYSFGDRVIDEYMGGGYGRENAYELICLFGDTGYNKSTLLSQMVVSAAARGAKVAYLALEDEVEDAVDRIDRQIVDGSGIAREEIVEKIMANIFFFPENDSYSLNSLADLIEKLFLTYDLVVIDPIQFVFEASIVENGESEFNRQRLFMRRLNNIMKKSGKTLVFVSHTNKSGSARDREDAGMMKIQGSGALQQICSKVIEIGRDKEGMRHLRLWKSRFTPFRRLPLQVKLDGDTMRISNVGYTPSEMMELRERW